MLQKTPGKLDAGDERMTQLLSWAPWLSFLMVSLPIPIVFLILFLAAASTEAAAIYFLLSFVSLGFGLVVGLFVLITLLFYRRRWHSRLRDRLAADGITAAEVPWFAAELSSDRKSVV